MGLRPYLCTGQTEPVDKSDDTLTERKKPPPRANDIFIENEYELSISIKNLIFKSKAQHVGLMLVNRLRCWTNIESILVQPIVIE